MTYFWSNPTLRPNARRRTLQPNARRRTHKDVEYHVSGGGIDDKVFRSFDEASSDALLRGVISGEAVLDVVIWSESGARFYGGDDAVEQYREDPEASVFERFEIRVNNAGRVP